MNSIFRVLCLMLLTTLSLPGASALAAPSAAEVTARVQKTYDGMNSFTADFEQSLTNAASKDSEQRSGRFIFAQPALIRWETKQPENELLVVGKNEVWNYVEAEKAAYRYSVEEVLGSKAMIKLLSGKANLSEQFFVKVEADAQAEAKGLTKLKLVPKEAEPGLVLAQVYVDNKTGMLARVVLQDFYGNTNDLSLTNLVLNEKLSPQLFVFTPPKGVKTFDNTGKGASEKNLSR